jgi:hypothetical protein
MMAADNEALEKLIAEDPTMKRKLSMELDKDAPDEPGQIALSLYNVPEGDEALKQVALGFTNSDLGFRI